MPRIEVTSGSVNLRSASAKTHVFHCPRRDGAGGDAQMVLFAAAKSARIGTAVRLASGFVQPIPAVNGVSAEIGGKVTQAAFEIAEGEIIKVVTSRSTGGALASPITLNAHRFYRVRTGAALMIIECKWHDDPRCPVAKARLVGPLEAP
jgi:hypothetical protein